MEMPEGEIDTLTAKVDELVTSREALQGVLAEVREVLSKPSPRTDRRISLV
jgi:hypothetical protein